MAQVEAARAGYATNLALPSLSRQKLGALMGVEGGVAYLEGGELEMRAGTDTEMLFRQESNFMYLSGFDHEHAKLLVGLDPTVSDGLGLGQAWLFVPPNDPVRASVAWPDKTARPHPLWPAALGPRAFAAAPPKRPVSVQAADALRTVRVFVRFFVWLGHCAGPRTTAGAEVESVETHLCSR